MSRFIGFASMANMFLFMLLVSFPTLSMQAQDANSILERAVEAYESSNGIEAAFAISTNMPAQSSSEDVEGTINIKGDKFTLVTPGMRTWFDGTTQWSYLERNEEVNVTTPTGDELLFTNPALLLKNYKRGFTAKYIGESTSKSGKTLYDIELTPKKKGDVVKVELRIEKFSSLPASIKVISKNGANSKIEIGEIKTNMRQPNSMFQFNPDDYPDAEVIDLR